MARGKHFRTVLVSSEYFAELMRTGALTCSKCGAELSQHGVPCKSGEPVLNAGVPVSERYRDMSEVLERHGYHLVVSEDLSGVASDLYVRTDGLFRAHISRQDNRVSVLMPGHYEVFTDPKSLDRALSRMFSEVANATVSVE